MDDSLGQWRGGAARGAIHARVYRIQPSIRAGPTRHNPQAGQHLLPLPGAGAALSTRPDRAPAKWATPHLRLAPRAHRASSRLLTPGSIPAVRSARLPRMRRPPL